MALGLPVVLGIQECHAPYKADTTSIDNNENEPKISKGGGLVQIIVPRYTDENGQVSRD